MAAEKSPRLSSSSAITPSTPTGIPSFRSLRSLLPFAPSKQPSTPTTNGIRSPFSNFGTVRRSISIQREKERGHDLPVTPVIAIGPSLPSVNELDGRAVRRSISCSGLASGSGNDEDDMIICSTLQPPTLRTPSPGPPISADLSTILEGDMSGISTRASFLDFSSIDATVQSAQSTRSHLPLLRPQPFSERDTVTTPASNFPTKSTPGSSRSSLLPRYSYNTIPPSPLSAVTTPASSSSSELVSRGSATLKPPSTPMDGIAGKPLPVTPCPSRSGDPTASALSPRQSSGAENLPRPSMSLDKDMAVPLRLPSPYKPFAHIRGHSSSSLSLSLSVTPPSPAPPAPVVVVVIDSPSPSPSPSSYSSPMGLGTHSRTTTASSTSESILNAATATRNRRLQHKRSISAFELGSSPAVDGSRGSLSPGWREHAHHDGDASGSVKAQPDEPGARDSPPPPSALPTRQQQRQQHQHQQQQQQQQQRARVRKRSMSVQEQSSPAHHPRASAGRSGTGVRATRGGGAASVQGRGPPRVGSRRVPWDQNNDEGWEDDYGECGGEPRASSSLSGRVRARSRMGSESGPSAAAVPRTYRLGVPDWMGPRTAKALKAAGLFDAEGADGGAGSGSGRFALTRSVSEYNPRVPSRMAVSDAGGDLRGGYGGEPWRGSAGRSRSGSDYGVLASPTHTAVSSGSTATTTTTTTATRERSASTAPTSLSAGSSCFGGRERELGSRMTLGETTAAEPKELMDLKEKHATETGALLHALSDSQRTVRVLREENDDLRGRIGRLGSVERENEGLRREVVDLRREVGGMKARVAGRVGAGGGSGRRFGGAWTAKPSGLGTATPLARLDMDDTDAEDAHEHDWGDEQDARRPWRSRDRCEQRRYANEDEADATMAFLPPTCSSTPIAISKKQIHARQNGLSSTSTSASSTFPTIPDNMTMLLHDDQDHDDSLSSHRLISNAISRPFSIPVPVPQANVSPTTADFSMLSGTTHAGSPGSIVLRPEHEMHLRDLENLDLGSIRFDEVENESDGW